MKNVAHAPGPWEYDKSDGLAASSHDWHVYSSSAKVGFKLPAICDTEANARLVAAAPDLLTASLAVLSLVESEGRDTGSGGAFSDLRDAIAKATGNA